MILYINTFIYKFIHSVVPKYLSPKSPKPGAMYFYPLSKTGSNYAVIILIFGKAANILSNPSIHDIKLIIVIFPSLNPKSIVV